jgi:hypothetical protein
VVSPQQVIDRLMERWGQARQSAASCRLGYESRALGEQHLRRFVKSYASYYNTARTHRSLAKDAPVCPVQRIGRIVSNALVGGLHHQYVRI